MSENNMRKEFERMGRMASLMSAKARTGKNTVDTYQVKCFDTIEAALTFLYAYRNVKGMIDPEINLRNPYSSRFPFAQDEKIAALQKEMRHMTLDDFVQAGKRVVSQGMPAIGITADIDDRKTGIQVRVSSQLFADSSLRQIYDNQYAVIVATYSTSNKANAAAVAKIEQSMDKWYKNNTPAT